MTETKREFLDAISLLEGKDLKESHISMLLDQIVGFLSENETEAIALIGELNENQATWLVTTFEELAFLFQNNDFIDAIENLSCKYPDIPDIQEYIMSAKYVMY